MTLLDKDLGEVTRVGDTVTIVFRRRYAKPVERVWAAITVPERLADWFCEVEIEALRPGAAITLFFREADVRATGRITIYEPMRTMEWTWPQPEGGESVIRFDVEADGAGARLTLTESGLPLKDGAGNAAGWHAHLDGLEGAMDGVRTSWAAILESEGRVNQIYKDRAPASLA
ncbi:SRPBCC family protein [Phenylobacterium sp.]|uniref:SRPBCC family protein n=1 Tax=Phenylobacterium sp. TaxID=1871053 RepID=UPI0012054F24|nr:SRPBCC family protein [Phenylobacterium sp.]TAL30820.1 MAG: SRPBCC family protein [Phenylobacterium sp.]